MSNVSETIWDEVEFPLGLGVTDKSDHQASSIVEGTSLYVQFIERGCQTIHQAITGLKCLIGPTLLQQGQTTIKVPYSLL